MAQVVMLASGKGGTGKSTVSVFLGAALCSIGKSTLLIELDDGLRSVDVISGVSGQTVYDIDDVISELCPIEKAVVVSAQQYNLNIISAPYNKGNITSKGLGRLIENVSLYFDFILIDTAAGLDNPFLAAASVATTAIIVTTPDIVAVRDGKIVATELQDLGVGTIKLILNKVLLPRYGKNPIENLDDCIDGVGAQLVGAVPNSANIYGCSSNGKALPNDSLEWEIFVRIAKRLCGVHCPLVIEQG